MALIVISLMESKCGENNHIHEHSFSLAYSLGTAHVMQVRSISSSQITENVAFCHCGPSLRIIIDSSALVSSFFCGTGRGGEKGLNVSFNLLPFSMKK